MIQSKLKSLQLWCGHNSIDADLIDSSLEFSEAKQELQGLTAPSITKKQEMKMFINQAVERISKCLRPAEKQIRALVILFLKHGVERCILRLYKY